VKRCTKFILCLLTLTLVFGTLTIYPITTRKIVYLDGEPDKFLLPLIVTPISAPLYPLTRFPSMLPQYDSNAVGEGYTTFPNKESCPLITSGVNKGKIYIEGLTHIPIEHFRWWRNYEVVTFEYSPILGMIIENTFKVSVFSLVCTIMCVAIMKMFIQKKNEV